MSKEWDLEILNHMFVHVLDKDTLDAKATNEFRLFWMHQGFDDIQFIMTMNKEDIKTMGHDVNFIMFQSP